jgi:hypothetical protein
MYRVRQYHIHACDRCNGRRSVSTGTHLMYTYAHDTTMRVQVNCSSVQCAHNGVCSLVNHQALCRCRPGFTGPLCEQDVDECVTQPCYNGAICENKEGTFECHCQTSTVTCVLFLLSTRLRLHRTPMSVRSERVCRRSVSQRRRVSGSARHWHDQVSVSYRLYWRIVWRDRESVHTDRRQCAVQERCRLRTVQVGPVQMSLSARLERANV